MPGPLPKYQPHFTAEEGAQAQQVVRQYHASHAKVRRAKMVLLLAEDPAIPTPTLAALAGVHQNTALKWRRRWGKEGFSLEDRPRSGRPPQFSPQQIIQVKALFLRLPFIHGDSTFLHL